MIIDLRVDPTALPPAAEGAAVPEVAIVTRAFDATSRFTPGAGLLRALFPKKTISFNVWK